MTTKRRLCSSDKALCWLVKLLAQGEVRWRCYITAVWDSPWRPHRKAQGGSCSLMEEEEKVTRHTFAKPANYSSSLKSFSSLKTPQKTKILFGWSWNITSVATGEENIQFSPSVESQWVFCEASNEHITVCHITMKPRRRCATKYYSSSWLQ